MHCTSKYNRMRTQTVIACSDSEETRALLQSFYKSIEKNPIIQPDDSENNSSKSTAGSSSIIRSLVRSMSLRSTVKQDGKSKTINYSSTDADKLEPYKQGPVRIKRVLDKSGQRASDRRWKEYFAYLNASDLILCRPLSPSRPLDHLPLRHSISSVLLRKYSDKHQYTLQLITMKGKNY